MQKFIKRTLISLSILASLSATAAIPAYGAEAVPVNTTQTVSIGGDFTKKKYNIKGDWTIIEKDGQTVLRLSEDFKTKSGPDLKIFLSPKSVETVTGKTATNGSVLLSALHSNKGTQDYVIPATLNLGDFASVLIHCEAYSVLWGGANLT
jgi:hypothetical protein